MERLQEKLNELLEKYAVGTPATLTGGDSVRIGGKEVPLLSFRRERRFVEMRNLVNNQTVEDVSVMRTMAVVDRKTDLNGLLYRELGVCEYVLNDAVRTVFTVKNGGALNCIAHTEKGRVCTLELAATLEPGEAPVDKHEVTARRGTVSDKVVDTQAMQSSIYLMGERRETYTDVDFELYGLSIPETARVRAAFEVARGADAEELIAADAHLKRLVAASDRSALRGEREGE